MSESLLRFRSVLCVAGSSGTSGSMCEEAKQVGAAFVIHNDQLYDVATGEPRTMHDLWRYVTDGEWISERAAEAQQDTAAFGTNLREAWRTIRGDASTRTEEPS